MQWRDALASQDQCADDEKSEVGCGVPSADDERRREGQDQDGQTWVDQTRDQQPLPILRRPSSPGRPYALDSAVAVSQARQSLVLEPGQKTSGGEAEPKQQYAAAVQKEPQDTAPDAADVPGRDEERTVGHVAADGEQGVVGALSWPGSEDLAQGQPCHAP